MSLIRSKAESKTEIQGRVSTHIEIEKVTKKLEETQQEPVIKIKEYPQESKPRQDAISRKDNWSTDDKPLYCPQLKKGLIVPLANLPKGDPLR